MVKWNKHNRIQLQRVADTGNTTKIPTKTKAMVLAGLGRPKWEHRWCFLGGASQANGGPRSGHLQHGLCAGRWTMLFALNEALRPTWPCALALHQRYDLQLCSLNIKWMNKICGVQTVAAAPTHDTAPHFWSPNESNSIFLEHFFLAVQRMFLFKHWFGSENQNSSVSDIGSLIIYLIKLQ